MEAEMSEVLMALKEEGYKEGRESGLKEGRESGLKEGQSVITQNLLNKGTDVAFIRDVTGLTTQEIIKIQKEMLLRHD